MPVEFDNLDAFEAEVMQEIGRRVDRAAALVESRMVDKVSTPGPPRSLPYQPPHRDTDALMEDVHRQTDFIAARSLIGSTLPHAGYLTFGTRRMAPRPFAAETLSENVGAVVSIVKGEQ